MPLTPTGQRQVGFVLDDETFTTIDPPADCLSASSATGINSAGAIVGWYFCADPNRWHAFVSFDMGDTFTVFDFPGTLGTTIASGINDKGQIVGHYWNVNRNDTSGFLLDDGEFTSIDVPGTVFTVATAINRHGVIAGYYLGLDGRIHGFIATPKRERVVRR